MTVIETTPPSSSQAIVSPAPTVTRTTPAKSAIFGPFAVTNACLTYEIVVGVNTIISSAVSGFMGSMLLAQKDLPNGCLAKDWRCQFFLVTAIISVCSAVGMILGIVHSCCKKRAIDRANTPSYVRFA